VRKVVTGLGRRAVADDRIDLARLILPANESVATSAFSPAADDNDSALLNRPFALNAKQLASDIEDQVVALVSQRLRHSDPRRKCRRGDFRLGNNALLIARQHR
jgi:hypothetical protein